MENSLQHHHQSQSHSQRPNHRRRQRRSHKPGERGIVLVAALVLAVLYFALMELMMMDASRSLQEAQRFRARVVASTLAENAAELAAVQMITKTGYSASYSDEQGEINGRYERSGDAYVLTGTGKAVGVVPQTISVRLQGRIVDNNQIAIDYADHSQ
jgi:hypothetical protein